MTNTLKEVLSGKKKELDEQEPKWRQRREEWLNDIRSLYSSIEKWLSDLVEEGYIRIAYENKIISEELSGAYSVQRMDIIFFNNQKIVLLPKGLYVIGAAGRIDMSIGDRTIMIVRVDDDLDWSFAEREGRERPKRWEFNEDTFKELLTEFAEAF